jgi:hypothetical protein
MDDDEEEDWAAMDGRCTGVGTDMTLGRVSGMRGASSRKRHLEAVVVVRCGWLWMRCGTMQRGMVDGTTMQMMLANEADYISQRDGDTKYHSWMVTSPCVVGPGSASKGRRNILIPSFNPTTQPIRMV